MCALKPILLKSRQHHVQQCVSVMKGSGIHVSPDSKATGPGAWRLLLVWRSPLRIVVTADKSTHMLSERKEPGVPPSPCCTALSLIQYRHVLAH